MDQFLEIMARILPIVVAALLGLVISVLFHAPLERRIHPLLLRAVGPLWIRSKEPLTDTWSFVWCREGQSLTRDEEVTEVKIQEFGKSIGATFHWRNRDYRIRGTVENNAIMTGTYEGSKAGRVFFGAFQLAISPGHVSMQGKWVGFDRNQKVVSGPWEWRRKGTNRYPFEYEAEKAQREQAFAKR